MSSRSKNTIIRQRTKLTDIAEHGTKVKWNWAGYIARMKDNRWTISSTEWQTTQGVRSVGRPKCRWRDVVVVVCWLLGERPSNMQA